MCPRRVQLSKRMRGYYKIMRRGHHGKRCKPCGKPSYPSIEEAMLRLEVQRHLFRAELLGIYACPHKADRWHLYNHTKRQHKYEQKKKGQPKTHGQ